jgi:hypothetical protein
LHRRLFFFGLTFGPQIECLVNGKLPSNLSNVIVFTRAGLSQLHNRIGELEEEKLSLKQQQVYCGLLHRWQPPM